MSARRFAMPKFSTLPYTWEGFQPSPTHDIVLCVNNLSLLLLLVFLAELSNHFSDLVESCSRRVLKCNDMHETRRRDIREHDEHKYLSDCHSALASRLIYDFKETHKWPSSAACSDYNFIALDTHSTRSLIIVTQKYIGGASGSIVWRAWVCSLSTASFTVALVLCLCLLERCCSIWYGHEAFRKTKKNL